MAEPNRAMVLRDLKARYKNLSEEQIVKQIPLLKAEVEQQ